MTVWPEGGKITGEAMAMIVNWISRQTSRKAYRFVIPASLEKPHSGSQISVIGD
ncbi:hypothetical protein HNR26_002032 [Rhizobium rosettiformans]|uniref:Uncharacterized protein n=1 Tax=Rhizobium rosettiformans TaxID=1368430 RepID=A0A7W8MD18_9HYPH|nr:hypothetical protein [Rhizobium rosettiformans]MBB5275980.1 hypothetical protein [Rhizobium rosettiformans]